MSALAELVKKKQMAQDWAEALAPVDDKVGEIMDRLRKEEVEGRSFLPAREAIFRAFEQPLKGVRVLIVGQDPYPNAKHAMGLAFSVPRDVTRLPPSLKNIYTLLSVDRQFTPPSHGDLSRWATQGVMLLNRALTVRPGARDSHKGFGWEEVTQQAVEAFANRSEPRAAILWGKTAQRGLTESLHEAGVYVVEAAHPSPLSASRGGFFKSESFSKVDNYFVEQGGVAVDWNIVDA